MMQKLGIWVWHVSHLKTPLNIEVLSRDLPGVALVINFFIHRSFSVKLQQNHDFVSGTKHSQPAIGKLQIAFQGNWEDLSSC